MSTAPATKPPNAQILLPLISAPPGGALMSGRRIWAFGGFVAGAVLILFGAAALYLGATSYQLVHDELSQEKIVGGEDMSPEAIAAGAEEAGLEDVDLPDCDVVDEEIDTGEEARCFSEYMRVHALEATGGLT